MTYTGDDRGSMWRKWDLHVHTPCSYEQSFGPSAESETWTKYLDDLRALPSEIEVIGINDYFSIEGYRRVRDEWLANRLPNIKLILPIVELRIDHLAGNSQTQRVNAHVLFAPEIEPDTIQNAFLNPLNTSHGEFKDTIGTREGMAAYGRAVRAGMPPEIQLPGSDEKVGFAHAFVKLDRLDEIRRATGAFERRTMLAIGYTEWASMRWEGGGGVIKKNLAAKADFFLGASAEPASHHRHVQALKAAGVRHRLLDASDAHRLSTDAAQDRRMGKTMTWIRADATFEGLRRALQRYDERVYVGDEPEQRRLSRTQKHRYVSEVALRKVDGSTFHEIWFDNHVELNPGLVAVIGNQGSGKSALTDTIALAANAENEDFSFLNAERFRKPRSRKASHYQIHIVWADGVSSTRRLDEARDNAKPERARYVPQHFFDLATNEVEFGDGGRLYEELERAVFSHVPIAQRQGCTKFRDLVQMRTGAIDEELATARDDLRDLNAAIADAERETADEQRMAVSGRASERNRIIAEHELVRPEVVGAPQEGEHPELATIRALVTSLEHELEAAKASEGYAFAQCEALKELGLKLRGIQRKAIQERDIAIADAGDGALGLNAEALLNITSDLVALDEKVVALGHEVARWRQLQNEEDATQPAARLRDARQTMLELTQSLGDAQRKYESYLTASAEWESRLQSLKEDPDDPDSLRSLDAEKKRVEEDVPREISRLRAKRGELCARVHKLLKGKINVYLDLARHVQEYLGQNELTRDHYKLEFELGLSCVGLQEGFFELVKFQGAFAGAESAKEWCKGVIDACSFDDMDEVQALAKRFLDRLLGEEAKLEHVHGRASGALKKGRALEEVYDLLFGLEFLRPRYRLSLGGRPLEQLSPGERAILLLIFYLIVDRSDLPLIIDQPEGNLNNQSIYEQLVPVFAVAKEKRQIIMVTHNPNMVVGCDADQIIHARIDHNDGFRVSYDSGALENPKYREFTVEKLEGTRPAFSEREEAYLDR